MRESPKSDEQDDDEADGATHFPEIMLISTRVADPFQIHTIIRCEE